MPTSLVVICFGTLALVIGAGASHETTVNVTGERVVNDILDRFNETGLETSDTVLLFMRRMAWVESKFGSSPYTFRRGFYGGIWQKNRKAFLMTQRFKIHLVLREKYQQIKDIFGIDWLRTSWRESRKPLYSALTAWLYLCLNPTQIPESLEDQAEFWVNYKMECAPMVRDFIRDVKILEDPLICNATGKDVVRKVIRRFRLSGWINDTVLLQFLKRIARVESNYGNDTDTFRAGFYGGIWQLDEEAFNETKNASKLAEKHDKVMELFGIDWLNDITWMDLKKPLYSGIAANLYLCSLSKDIPSSVEAQAMFWKMYYNKSDDPTEQDFIDRNKDDKDRHAGNYRN